MVTAVTRTLGALNCSSGYVLHGRTVVRRRGPLLTQIKGLNTVLPQAKRTQDAIGQVTSSHYETLTTTPAAQAA